MNIADVLARTAHVTPDLPAVIRGRRVVQNYARLGERAARLAGALQSRLGLGAGDRVALITANTPAYVELLFAIWHGGLAAVPLNAKLHTKEFSHALAHSQASVCFAGPALAETVSALRSELPDLKSLIEIDGADYEALFEAEAVPVAPVAADDTAWLFYTSGTTGRPKGAMLSHANLIAMTLGYFANVDRIAPGECILHAAPMSHGSGIYILPHVWSGAANIIPESGRFDPAEVFDLIAAHRGVTIFAAPTMVKRLVEHPAAATADTANLKTIVYGGGPMYLADLDAAMARLGPKLAQIYGQGESPMMITALNKDHHAQTDHPRFRERLASAGVAQLPMQVMIADDENRPVAPGTVGEVLARGPAVMRGYWRNLEATAEALKGGWLHTGDLGMLDEDGFLTLTDRSKDLIISGGANIYPREIEEVLLTHPGIGEVSVIGRPDPDWGEVAVAVVVAAGATVPDEADLDAHCLANIARFKRPKHYVFLQSLPKNSYGKVLKTRLRDMLAKQPR